MTTVGRSLRHMAPRDRPTDRLQNPQKLHVLYSSQPECFAPSRHDSNDCPTLPRSPRILILTATYHDSRSTKPCRCPKITHWHRSYWQGSKWLHIWSVTLTVLTPYKAAPCNRYQPHPSEPAQHTTCSNTSCSPEDGHNDARNMLRYC